MQDIFADCDFDLNAQVLKDMRIHFSGILF